jgi:outer membrane receptor for ferric coprogen and ferric-rhodotorulic acid
MSSIITPQQMTDFLLKTLEDAVKDIPEERREAVKAKVLEAFSVGMFKGPKENNT